MLTYLSQLTDFLHQAFPYLVALALGLFAAIVHRKNQELQKDRVEIAENADNTANAKTEENISNLEEKVAADDKKRIELEEAMDSPSFDRRNSK